MIVLSCSEHILLKYLISGAFCIELIHFFQELDKTRKAIPEVLPGLDQNLANASAPFIEPPSYYEAVFERLI